MFGEGEFSARGFGASAWETILQKSCGSTMVEKGKRAHAMSHTHPQNV